MCIFKTVFYWLSEGPPHPLAGFGRVSETKPDVFRWHKCQEPLFQNRSPSPAPCPLPRGSGTRVCRAKASRGDAAVAGILPP